MGDLKGPLGMNSPRPHRVGAGRAIATLREQIAIRRAIADQVISLAQLLGRSVRTDAGARVGRVSDVVVRWDGGVAHPPVVACLIGVGSGLARLEMRDVVLRQNEIRLQSAPQMVWGPIPQQGDVALARDVLDHQLVDLAGVQVVRAADVYLFNGPGGWELAGIDVGLRSLARRLLPKTKVCPPPDRVIDWAQLHAFVARFTDTTSAWTSGPTTAAGMAGSGLQLAGSAAHLKELRAQDVTALFGDLSRDQQAQLVASAPPSPAVEALSQLDADHREALLAALDEPDRERLRALLEGHVG